MKELLEGFQKVIDSQEEQIKTQEKIINLKDQQIEMYREKLEEAQCLLSLYRAISQH